MIRFEKRQNRESYEMWHREI